jgi:hypothetical protein
MSDVTHLLSSTEACELKVACELFPLVYQGLRLFAAGKVSGEAADNTLQPTELVHDAWLHLVATNVDHIGGVVEFEFGSAHIGCCLLMRQPIATRIRGSNSSF